MVEPFDVEPGCEYLMRSDFQIPARNVVVRYIQDGLVNYTAASEAMSLYELPMARFKSLVIRKAKL